MKPWHYFILLVLAFGLGLKAGLVARDAAVAKVHAAEAKKARAAAEDAAAQLKAAMERGDELTLQLATSAKRIEILSKEKRDALKHVTTGRPCLGTAALRVLDAAPGLRVADLPSAASVAAAGDGPVATDTDIGQWSIAAGSQFELCRERLGKLIAWHRGQP